MADTTLPGGAQPCKAAASAYFDGALVAEDLAIDAQRIAETAWALACSQSFAEATQHCFVALANLAERLQEKAKKAEDRLTGLSGKGEAAQ